MTPHVHPARFALALAVLLAGATIGEAQLMPGAGGAQMPDAKQMSGMPLPVGDLQPGTVVVRMVKGAMTNPIAGQRVDLVVDGTTRSATTNDAGRAEFTALRPGSRVRATAVVDGETLESQEFGVPSAGGIRVALVATDPELEKKAQEDRRLAQGPAVPGIVVMDDQSRFVVEMGDAALSVFNIVQILNTARTPVQPKEPVTFDLPEEAEGASLLDGSSPQAALAGRRVTVKGPFAPGATLVQFAYSMPYSGGDLSFSQRLPVPLTRLTILAQKVGDMHLASPQLSEHRDMTAEGQIYILGQGPALQAGDVVTFDFTGLPHAPLWPRNLALGLALGILAAGGWASLRQRGQTPEEASRHKKLHARRDRLFAELAALEEQHRAGRLDPDRYVVRRRDLVAGLERVYAELGEEAAA